MHEVLKLLKGVPNGCCIENFLFSAHLGSGSIAGYMNHKRQTGTDGGDSISIDELQSAISAARWCKNRKVSIDLKMCDSADLAKSVRDDLQKQGVQASVTGTAGQCWYVDTFGVDFNPGVVQTHETTSCPTCGTNSR